MKAEFNHSEIEAKWQKKWKDKKVYETDFKKAKDPYYCLTMFPYPSGARLHVGHWYMYSVPDTFSRFQKMLGKDVFHPMGFDAFGLPAENYAIKTGTPPAKSTEDNVGVMIEQFKRMGCMYDWSKTLNTSEPEYYRWTQWLFLKMFEKDLAYKKDGNVNFCSGCQTVLANEQVWDGKCERCETEVVQKPLAQWYWKITDYSDRLLEGLDKLEWPEKTKMMQRNWIGRKEGIDIHYEIEDCEDEIVCFTTRPDTNFGATFIVLAPEHEFAQKIIDGELKSDHKKEVADYVKKSLNKTELERQEEGKKKTGAFTGYYALNNLNGKKMPIWVSDFVLAGFGTGAVVGVPGHDVRDFEFADEYDLEVIRVVVASDGDDSPITKLEQVQEAEGTMINSGFLDGMNIHDATQKVMDHMAEKGWGKRVTTYRLRDWLVSRQRYWGSLIPIVYDPDGKAHPVPEEHLPWLLPTDVEFKPTGTSPIAESKELKKRVEKIFGKGWTPEVDTMDTFVCSSFYQFRFLSENNQKELVPKLVEKKWMPVDMYIGGPEHACMHLIYARFVTKALKDMGYVSVDEPFQKLFHQGLITHKGAKMSKSKGNVVSPDDFVKKYGSDVFRLYMMFMGPFADGGDWNDTGIKGLNRFAKKAYKIIIQNKFCDQSKALTAGLHRTIKKCTEEMEAFRFNTAIAALMEFLNLTEKEGIDKDSAEIFIKLLGPLAPHLAEELWESLGGKGFVVEQEWPKFDEKLTLSDTVTIAVQVNGKLRGDFEADAGISESDAISKAKEVENVKRFIDGKKPKKEIYIEGKLVNIVV